MSEKLNQQRESVGSMLVRTCEAMGLSNIPERRQAASEWEKIIRRHLEKSGKKQQPLAKAA